MLRPAIRDHMRNFAFPTDQFVASFASILCIVETASSANIRWISNLLLRHVARFVFVLARMVLGNDNGVVLFGFRFPSAGQSAGQMGLACVHHTDISLAVYY